MQLLHTAVSFLLQRHLFALGSVYVCVQMNLYNVLTVLLAKLLFYYILYFTVSMQTDPT